MPDEAPPPEKSPKPRRRWKRWVFGFLILLTALLIWANGPGIRWAVNKVILQQLEAQKLSGTFEVTGTVLSGLAIHNLSLKGESKISSVESNLLKIDWSLSSLLKKELEAITLDKLHLVYNPKAPALPETSDGGPTEESEKKPLNDTLNLVRGFLQPAKISLTDLRFEMVETTTVSLAALTHEPKTTDYLLTDLLTDLRTVDHLDRPIHNPKTTLSWTEPGFALDQVTLLPQLKIQALVFHPDQKASAEIFIDENKISLSSDLQKAHRLTLDSPALEIKTIADLVKPDLPANGLITALEIDTSKGLINLQGRDLQWAEQKLATASIEARAPDLLSPFEQDIEVKIALEDRLTVNGTITPAKEPLDSQAKLAFTAQDPAIPTVTGDLTYASREAQVVATALEDLRLTGTYFVDSSTYQAKAISKIKDAAALEKTLTGPLDFSLTAKGDLKEKTHAGTLNLDQLKLNKEGLPDATTSGIITYDWPKKVTVTDLKMTSPEGRIQANLDWQNDLLTISQLDLIEGTTKLLTATAKLPASLEFRSLDDLLASPEPISLKVKSLPLTFNKLSSFAPIPPELSAIVEADLSLSGTFAKPALNGFATLNDFRTRKQPDLPPLDLDLNFETREQKLLLTAKATEPGGPLLDLDGNIPFLPRAWIDKEKDPTNSPLDIRITSPELDLRRVQPFAPIIERITGNLKLDVLVSGTLADPKYSGSAKARITKMRLAKSPISDFRNTNFNVTFSGKTATIQPSQINASGGSAKVSGTINLEEKEPVFNIDLNGRYILLHRTADYTFRGHTNLNLSGPLSAATVSGKVEITESLFYKDVEILPFGVPRTTDIPEPNLPGFSQAPQPTTTTEEKSGGVMDWKLNIAVTTLDPILIRGNLARGEITGNVLVSGTIGDPKTSGSLVTNELEADLPFSHLKIQSGLITLRPDSLTNPLVNIRGSSTIGQYTVQVFLNGPVQNPNLVLTSDPPLPESEIMLLLATGSASAQLEDRQVASQKALQYLLEGIRRRNRGKDKSLFQRLLKNSDQIELSLGDTNQFSGRKYSSATLELSDQWDFTTQIDDAGQTRALVVFSIRLR